MAHVLLAGGAGFIGSHLTDRLLDRGDTVVCVDDLSTGSREHTKAHAKDDRYWFLDRDITLLGLAEAIGSDRFDVVMNFASPASPPAYLARPIETLAAGSTGTRALLELALRPTGPASSSPRRARSMVIRSNTRRSRATGATSTRWGRASVYDEAKRFSEALTAAYGRVHGLEVRIARIFNTYGPRMQFDDGRVVTNLVHQALTGEPLTLYGDGSQTRSFCYVDDEVTRVARPARRSDRHAGQHRQPARGDDARARGLGARADRLELERDQHAATCRRSASAPTRHLLGP